MDARQGHPLHPLEGAALTATQDHSLKGMTTMPLCSAIYDADTTEERILRWGWWHIQCMTLAAQAHEPATKDMPILEVWSYPSLQAGLDIEYPMCFRDPTDGEVLILNRGDRLEIWRES